MFRWPLITFFSLVGCAHHAVAPTVDNDPAIVREVGALFVEGVNARNFATVESDAASGLIGGVVIFAPAFADYADLVSKVYILQSAAHGQLIVAMDGEGGSVMRLPGLETASAKAMGRRGTDFTGTQAREMARFLHQAGVGLNLAPVVDLELNLDGLIAQHQRSFGSHPMTVALLAKAFADAHRGEGVHTVLKHFPGHGSSGSDSHAGVADISASWNEKELVPYRSMIESGFDGAVMTGHLMLRTLDGKYPASLSRAITQDLLRGKLGFRGPVITDDLQMGAVAKEFTSRQAVKLALEAGADLLLFAQQYREENLRELQEWLVGEVRAGRIARARVQEAGRRSATLR